MRNWVRLFSVVMAIDVDLFCLALLERYNLASHGRHCWIHFAGWLYDPPRQARNVFHP